ncbi:nucleotidyltransferase family protein [Terrarubrum flagellatum]|uniref:nucleotidyltransferase family protein n=1 Tax=Terrirubrum flagellatum TaxID=2895980 RepID=UPI0031451B1E
MSALAPALFGEQIPQRWRALAAAPLTEQIEAVGQIVRDDPDLMAALRLIRDLELPDGWLCGGCIYQTIWNVIACYPRRTGVKDYDIGYFDPSDLSYEAEDRVIRRVEEAGASLGLNLEVRNQARVHLWFEQRFGYAVPPLASAAEAPTRYASTTHAIGVRLTEGDRIDVVAPYGLRDIFAMHLRPNRSLPNGPTHDAKAKRCQAIWPMVTVEWW